MRSILATIVLLTCCFLGTRWLWSEEVAAEARVATTGLPSAAAAAGEQRPETARRGAMKVQNPVQPFAAPDPVHTASMARLPVAGPDLGHVREFEFDAAALRALAMGDTLRIDFPPLGGRYELAVDQIVDDASERTIRGHIDYDRRQYPTLITITDGWSFGSFTTPEGHFEFTARDGRAQMVSSAELERRAYAPNHTLFPRRF